MPELRHLAGAPLLLLSGCLLGPDWVVPEVPVPDGFAGDAPAGESIANVPWWELFGDETLKELIGIALEENKDAGIALERIAEARARLGFVKADEYPSFGYAGTARREDRGDRSVLGETSPSNEFRYGADMFFEVDLWGKLRRSTEAARAELAATESAYVSVIITLVADVANTYLLLLDLDEQLEITRRTFDTRRDATRIIGDRFREGVVAKLDLNQAEIEEATAEVGIPQIERDIVAAENALRVLLGRNPGSIVRGKGLDGQVPIEVPVGLPSRLLQRRPDVKIAEHVAAAETARIGVAEALRFPSLSLTGALGMSSDDSGDLFDSKANFWSIGTDVVGPIYEFGQNVRRVEIAESSARQAVLDYERTVLVAFQEVEDALAAVRTFRQEYDVRTRQVASAREAAILARALYDEQFKSYLDVLDTERSLFEAELEQSVVLRASLQSVVRLYKALGGGWSPPEDDGAASADGS